MERGRQSAKARERGREGDLWVWRIPGNADGHRVQRKQTPQHGNQSPLGKVRRRNHLIWKCFLNWCTDSGKIFSQMSDFKTASLLWKFPWKSWGRFVETECDKFASDGVGTLIWFGERIVMFCVFLIALFLGECILWVCTMWSNLDAAIGRRQDQTCFVEPSYYFHKWHCNFRFFLKVICLQLLFHSLLPQSLPVRGIACVGFGILLWYSLSGGILHVPDVTY